MLAACRSGSAEHGLHVEDEQPGEQGGQDADQRGVGPPVGPLREPDPAQAVDRQADRRQRDGDADRYRDRRAEPEHRRERRQDRVGQHTPDRGQCERALEADQGPAVGILRCAGTGARAGPRTAEKVAGCQSRSVRLVVTDAARIRDARGAPDNRHLATACLHGRERVICHSNQSQPAGETEMAVRGQSARLVLLLLVAALVLSASFIPSASADFRVG